MELALVIHPDEEAEVRENQDNQEHKDHVLPNSNLLEDQLRKKPEKGPNALTDAKWNNELLRQRLQVPCNCSLAECVRCLLQKARNDREYKSHVFVANILNADDDANVAADEPVAGEHKP